MKGRRDGVGGMRSEGGREWERGGKPRAFVHHQRIRTQTLVDLAPGWGGVGRKGCRLGERCEALCDEMGGRGD